MHKIIGRWLGRTTLLPLALCIVCPLLSGASNDDQIFFPRETIFIQSAADTHRLSVEVARSRSQRTRGLMHRTTLAADQGMLFLYPRPQIARMWMKDTPIPLDMLFIDECGIILEIVPQTTPNSMATIASTTYVKGVLEIRAGLAQEMGIAVGDEISHPAFKR